MPDWGMFVHTFNNLVPPGEYYDEHPEYYAMVDGERIPTQLCLTNENVLQITIRNLRRAISQNPEATYWSVSQNDNQEYCTCDECSLIDEREGSGAGTMVHFVNQVAGHFPDRIISTLAYQYSRRPPKNLKPRENVNIMLTNIELERHLSIPDNPEASGFRSDLEGWAEIANVMSPDPGSYSLEELKHLTNGVRGGHTFLYNWLSVTGDDFEVVIDLGKVHPVSRIETAWYQHAQWGMILPEKLEYYVSKDGHSFKLVAEVGHDLPIDQYGAQIRDFVGEFEPQKTRYVRVRAVNIGQIPSWHPTPAGAGRPAQILIDEIVVE